MSMFYADPDDGRQLRASDLQSSLGEQAAAHFGESFFGATRGLYRIGEYNRADSPDEPLSSQIARLQSGADLADVVSNPQPVPELPIADARARVKQEGLEGRFKLPDQDTIKPAVLELMLAHAHERDAYNAAVARGPQGIVPGALGLVTEIGAGVIDPVNIAAFSIPVIREARLGMLMAGAGESLFARAGVRLGVGALQGAAGTAVLAPADWWLKTRDGLDYTFADTLHSILMNAGMGGVMHAGFGAVGDVRARLAGRPLEGAPSAGTPMAPENRPAEPVGSPPAREAPEATEVPGISGSESPPGIMAPEPPLPSAEDVPASPEPFPDGHPAAVLADLPPRAREDAVRSAIADVISGEPVRAGDMLAEAAKADPRIAESIDAWHGSPHDFDRFDMGKIGTGEGAQSYGHGLYFAENEAVARSYQDKLAATLRDVGAENVRELGNLYRVSINADRDRFLDYDRPLSEQPHALAAVGRLPADLRSAVEAHYKIAADAKAQDKANALAFNREKLRKLLDDAGGRDPARLAEQVRSARETVEHLEHALAALRDAATPSWKEMTGDRLAQIVAEHLGERHRNADHIEGMPIVARAAASAALRDAGLPGIRYLDQGSRLFNGTSAELRIAQIERALKESPGDGTAEDSARIAKLQKEIEGLKRPTHNLVVFDDKHVEITHKNGEPVSRGERAEILHGQENNPDGAAVIPGPRAARGPRARDPETWSLNEFLAHRGGLDPTDPMIGDVRSSIGSSNKFVPGFGHLIRKGGMRLDRAREAAVEAGYIHDNGDITGGQSETTIRSLLDAIDGELRGNRVYRAGREPEAKGVTDEENRAGIEREAVGALRDEGIDPASVPDKTLARVVEIMHREGESDALIAYERAVMEETHYGAEAGEHEPLPDPIPGWSVPDDAGAAPGAGRAVASVRQDRARGAAREFGEGDRAASGEPGRAGDVKPDWDRLAERRGEDAELVDAAADADAIKDVPSTEPDKAPSAAERAAAQASELLDDIRSSLTESERETFDRALEKVEDDRAAHEQIVREGAACLMAAVA